MNNDTLQKLVEEAYRLFSNYELGNEIAVCTYCCMSKSEVKLLKTVPLQSLEVTTIYQYLDSAEGSENPLINQMRYLLPRILELLAMGKAEELRYSDEITLNKLHCDNPLWRAEELAFLKAFAKSYLQQQINSANSDFYDMISTITMFDDAKLTMDLTDEFFNVILKNADDPKMINDMIYFVNYIPISRFASHELNQNFTQFFQTDNFKSAFLTAILRKVESDDYDTLSQDEINLYEVAFSVFSNI